MKEKRQQLTLTDLDNFSQCETCPLMASKYCEGRSLDSFGEDLFNCAGKYAWSLLENNYGGAKIEDCRLKRVELNLPNYLLQVYGGAWNYNLRCVTIPFHLLYDRNSKTWDSRLNLKKRFKLNSRCLVGVSFLDLPYDVDDMYALDWKDISTHLNNYCVDFVLSPPYGLVQGNPVLKNIINMKRVALFCDIFTKMRYNVIPHVSFSSQLDMERWAECLNKNNVDIAYINLSVFEYEYNSKRNLENSVEKLQTFLEKITLSKLYISGCNYARILQLTSTLGDRIGFLDWRSYKNAKSKRDIFGSMYYQKSIRECFLSNVMQLENVRNDLLENIE